MQINHSLESNIGYVSEDDRKGDNVTALRKIKVGEEILIDFNEVDEPKHLKESWFYQD